MYKRYAGVVHTFPWLHVAFEENHIYTSTVFSYLVAKYCKFPMT